MFLNGNLKMFKLFLQKLESGFKDLSGNNSFSDESIKNSEDASGGTLRQQVKIIKGIERDLAQSIIKILKSSKIKVQTSIQGDELRVSGKKRDDLQEVINLVKEMKDIQPLQFVNFRD